MRNEMLSFILRLFHGKKRPFFLITWSEDATKGKFIGNIDLNLYECRKVNRFIHEMIEKKHAFRGEVPSEKV